MREIYELQRIRKEMRNRTRESIVGEYELSTIHSLRGMNLISDEESDFLLTHLAV